MSLDIKDRLNNKVIETFGLRSKKNEMCGKVVGASDEIFGEHSKTFGVHLNSFNSMKKGIKIMSYMSLLPYIRIKASIQQGSHSCNYVAHLFINLKLHSP
jgi:hypothetical protein